MTDKPIIHIDSDKVREEILDYQVQDCPTCGTELEQSFGLAGGGFGAYGYCTKCEKVIWKVTCEE